MGTPSARVRVLLVEDSTKVRQYLHQMLLSQGADCAAVGTGVDAVEQLRAQPWDFLVLDLNLPGMHGTRVLSWLRSTDLGWPAPTVIVASAWSEDLHGELAELEVEHILQKPFRRQALTSLILGRPESPPASG